MKKHMPSLWLTCLTGLVTGCANKVVMQVRDIGSKHLGGRAFVLEGLPEKEISFLQAVHP